VFFVAVISIIFSWDNLSCIYKEAGETGEEKKVFCKKKIR
jgi:hypothetical protein